MWKCTWMRREEENGLTLTRFLQEVSLIMMCAFPYLTLFFESLSIWESLFWGMLEERVHTIVVMWSMRWGKASIWHIGAGVKSLQTWVLEVHVYPQACPYICVYIYTYIWTNTSQKNFSLEIAFFFNIAKKFKSWFNKIREICITMFLQHAIKSSSREESNSMILQFTYVGYFPPPPLFVAKVCFGKCLWPS